MSLQKGYSLKEGVSVPACVELGEEAINVLLPKSSVTATGNTVCPYYPAVTPPSQRIAMDVEKAGYFPYCEHRPQVITYHIFPHLPFNYLDDNLLKLPKQSPQITNSVSK